MSSDLGEFKTIDLPNGLVCLVDPADYEHLSRFSWHVNNGYVCRSVQKDGVRSLVYIHRFLKRAVKGDYVDHRDGNKLNNRRRNLRKCTASQNSINTGKRRGKYYSRYKGVTFIKVKNRWKATIGFQGKRFYIGSFHTELEAAKAYDKKAKELFGEFAKCNLT